MTEEVLRTALLLGTDAMQRLKQAKVAVFGIGGVGGHAAEALARSGVGALELIDNDEVSKSNINRQIVATQGSIGRAKVEVMKERILDIWPQCQVTIRQQFYLPENKEEFPFAEYDYIIDAIDTVTGKISLVCQADVYGVPIISSMGAGNKLDPTAFEVADIYQTSVCPLAKVMRKELKARGIKKLKVVYSKELPRKPDAEVLAYMEAQPQYAKELQGRRQIPGSIAFVPSVAGLILAGEVVKDLVKQDICMK